MKIAIVPLRLGMLCGLLVGAYGLTATTARAERAPPVDFAVAKQDASIFYSTRWLRKGDRFEVNVHQLHDFNKLIVVPCHPDCGNPDFAIAYNLHAGIQHFQVPTTGQYYFFLQRSTRPDLIVRNGQTDTRVLLPVLASESTPDRFIANFDRGTVLSMRTLYTRPLPDELFEPAN
jgi:hypothetical protein